MNADDQSAKAGTTTAKRSNVVKVFHWGDRPPIVICLLGSSRFKNEFLSTSRAFTLQGHITLMPGVFGHTDGGFVDGEVKKRLDDLQRKKIEMADIVYVVNPKGYIGTSTKRDIEFAESMNKVIHYLDS